MEISFNNFIPRFNEEQVASEVQKEKLIEKICLKHLHNVGLNFERIFQQLLPIAAELGVEIIVNDHEFQSDMRKIIEDKSDQIFKILYGSFEKELENKKLEELFWLVNNSKNLDQNVTQNLIENSKIIIQNHDHELQENLESLFTKTFFRTIDSFDEVTKYLPNKSNLLQTILPEGYGEEVFHLLQYGKWTDLSTHNMEHFACQVLKLFYAKRITSSQLATSIFYWSLRQQFRAEEIEIVPLFHGKAVNQKAKKALLQTLTSSAKKFSFIEKHLDELMLKMREEPLSEQFFFSVKEEKFPIRSDSVTHSIKNRIGLNLFTSYLEGEQKIMSVSFSMLQNFLEVYAKDHAVKILPRFNESSIEDIINNGKNGTRDLGLPFFNFVFPKTADLLSALHPRDFWMHDFYHSLLASLAPHSHRQAFIRIADRIGTIASDDQEKMIILNELKERLIDMEVRYLEYEKKGEKCFYQTLDGMYESISNRLQDKNKTFLKEFHLKQKIYKEKIFLMLAKGALIEIKSLNFNKEKIHSFAKESFKNVGTTLDSEINTMDYYFTYGQHIPLITSHDNEDYFRKRNFAQTLRNQSKNSWKEHYKETMILIEKSVSVSSQLSELLQNQK